MDVFALRDRVVGEYRRYAESFVDISDERIREEVDGALDSGLLWPHPRIGLNPAFEPGASVDELVESGRLHPTAGQIFRAGKSADYPQGDPLVLHRHQAEAVESAAAGRNYVLTTGTGSGKSLAYIIPTPRPSIPHTLQPSSGPSHRHPLRNQHRPPACPPVPSPPRFNPPLLGRWWLGRLFDFEIWFPVLEQSDAGSG